MNEESYLIAKQALNTFDHIEKQKTELYEIIKNITENSLDLTSYNGNGYVYINSLHISKECCDNLKLLIIEELNNELGRLNQEQLNLNPV